MQKIEITYDLTQNRMKRMQGTQSVFPHNFGAWLHYNTQRNEREAVNCAEDASYLHINLLAFCVLSLHIELSLSIWLLIGGGFSCRAKSFFSSTLARNSQ